MLSFYFFGIAIGGNFNNEVTLLYPFGYGLSYTNFEISKPWLSKTEIRKNRNMEVMVVLKNIGDYDGDEIVQLYIRDDLSINTRPVKELKDFKRESLNTGNLKR